MYRLLLLLLMGQLLQLAVVPRSGWALLLPGNSAAAFYATESRPNLALSSLTRARGGDPSSETKTMEKSEENGRGFWAELKVFFCSLRYLVYFVWFAVVVVIFFIVLLADLATGFGLELMHNYLVWVDEVSRDIYDFYEDIGCYPQKNEQKPAAD